MSPSIELSSATFARLQDHAVPLVDNIESVINRLVDFYEAKAGGAAPVDGSSGVNRSFAVAAPPDLTHTKILSVKLNGKPLGHDQAKWNSLLFTIVREAKARTSSDTDFHRLGISNIIEKEKNDEGYRYLPDLGISVQQRDANATWRTVSMVAQKLGLALEVVFVWRDRDGAAFPGVTGQFSIAPR